MVQPMLELQRNAELSRAELADVLRRLAAELDPSFSDELLVGGGDDTPGDGPVTLLVDEERRTFAPADVVEMNVEIEEGDPLVGAGKEGRVSIDLSWPVEPATETDDLRLQ